MKVKDPVCGMELEQANAAAQARHEGRTYYFCSESCKSRFEKNPAQYAAVSER